jgi:chorismate dehydratase
MFRVATAPFLSGLPLIDWFLADPGQGVQVTFALPNQLAEMLHGGQADVALLPVLEHFRGHSAYVVPGIGIASHGAVGSVKLFTKVAPATLNAISVDRAAKTSVALLRVLLAEVFGVLPDLFAVEPQPGNLFKEAAGILVVGDRCFEAEKETREKDLADVRVWDLGELWFRYSKLPFVFAAWGFGSGFTQRKTSAQSSLVRLLTQARDHGLAQLDALAEREARVGRLGPGGEANPETLRFYLRDCLRYVLGKRELAGMNRFYELCVKHAICPTGCFPGLEAVDHRQGETG